MLTDPPPAENAIPPALGADSRSDDVVSGRSSAENAIAPGLQPER
jgi:hypothetical protein